MPTTSSPDAHRAADIEESSTVPAGVLITVVASLAAAWIAAGSFGLLGHPLRHGLTWLALGVAIVAEWPRRGQSLTVWLTMAGAVALGLVMTVPLQPAVNVLAVAVVTAALVRSQADLRGRVILLVALATAVLGIFRLACTSIPTVWLTANAVGRALGWPAGWLTGEPLRVGASFGGVDFLVVMATLYAGWLTCTTPPRLPRAIYAAVAILLGHLAYLVVLAHSNALLSKLPDVVLPESSEISAVGVWAWANSARAWLPWNLPVLAGLIHATIAVAMFRWATWLPAAEPSATRNTRGQEEKGLDLLIDASLRFGPVVLAVLIPVLTMLGQGESDLKNKTIVAYDQGFLDWQKPEYDKPSPGTYGMLPVFIESLGGRFETSADLSDLDPQKVHVLLLLHANQPWSQETLDRVWEFVRGGGALLLAAGPRVRSGELESRVNDVLDPTGMRIRYDTAVPATTHWEHCCQPLAHPATAGIDDRRNRFGLLFGSSIRTRWPARPILAGRYAWSDPGSDAANTGTFQYESGEALGDLVLAAEQRLGQGKIVVLGDASSLHNDAIAKSYPFVGRLLGDLAAKTAGPLAWWRQGLALLATAALVGLLAWRGTAVRTVVAAAVLGVSMVCCLATSHAAARVLPDGRKHAPNNLAYIDASHLEAYSSDTWGDFGIGGLARTLMRSGYLPLLLPEPTPERLERAGVLISIAPARPYSRDEREAVRDFVHNGGSFVCMVGAEEVAASRAMLADFDFAIPPSPVPPLSNDPEPVPLGAVRTLYINLDDQKVAMQSYASWEVECRADNAWKMAQWSDGETNRPFITSRPAGRGTVAVVGDTYLAVNGNLESAVNTMPENITFWRWFLTRITEQPEWSPPREKEEDKPAPFEELPPEAPTDGDAADGDAAGGDSVTPEGTP